MYRALRPLLFALDAERAHEATLAGLALASRSPGARRLLAWSAPPADPRLRVQAFGLTFPNPLGLAAGLDKDGRALPAWAALGLGAVELGTVTARAQRGNPRPRLERLHEDEALVNRMGFNNRGAEALAARLAGWRRAGAWPRVPVGVNVGKSGAVAIDAAVPDYRASLAAVVRHADYLVVNVSSPNTPGLRELQQAARLDELLAALVEATAGTPLLVKLAPELDEAQLEAVAGLAEQRGAAGLVAVNTTLERPGLRRQPRLEGGLSGRPLAPRARRALRALRVATRLPIVSVGGIDGPHEAWRRLDAGADLLQVYTSLVYQGPGLVRRILAGLTTALERRGLPSVGALRSRA